MIRKVQHDLYQIGSPLVRFYLLLDQDGAALIDGGFVGDLSRLKKALRQENLDWKGIHSILLTHGHLDHTHNVVRIKDLSGATIYGDTLDDQHFEGRFPYQGISRCCGILEAIGRGLFGFKRVVLDKNIHDGEIIDVWGGIRVIHLPGHTDGHCGFLSLKHDLFFTGVTQTTTGTPALIIYLTDAALQNIAALPEEWEGLEVIIEIIDVESVLEQLYFTP